MNYISFSSELELSRLPLAPRRALLALERIAEYRLVCIEVSDLKCKYGLWGITCFIPRLDKDSDLDINFEELFEYLANIEQPLPLSSKQVADVERLILELDVEINSFGLPECY